MQKTRVNMHLSPLKYSQCAQCVTRLNKDCFQYANKLLIIPIPL